LNVTLTWEDLGVDAIVCVTVGFGDVVGFGDGVGVGELVAVGVGVGMEVGT
jgi:hypothetical protein